MSMRSQTISSFDAVTRRILLLLGALVLALGLLTLVVIQPLVGVLPSSSGLVTIIFIVTLLLGLWMIRARYRNRVQQATVPNVERVLSTAAPGNDLDEMLYQLTHNRQGTIEYREQIRERLATLAVAVIRQQEDCSRAEAVQMLEEGTWTDNAYASAFFAGGNPPKQSLTDRIAILFLNKGQSPYERWVRITIDTIVEQSGAELYESDDDDENSAVLPLSSYRLSAEQADSVQSEDGITFGNRIITGHWRGISALALVAAGWGGAMYQPEVFLLGVVGIAFTAYARSGSEPPIEDLEVTRYLSDETPQPGESVEVTVTVENTGDTFMPDLRLVDRVPGPMEVIEGSPRLATALGSGSTATFSYTVVAERGTYEWPLVVYGRDFSGSVEQEAAIDVENGITCVPSLKTTGGAPVRSQTSLYSGQVNTSIGGPGLEFFAVREYREGDPMKRIDWKRHARTGELATIDFRQERAAKVMLLFDSRESAYVSPRPNDRHAVDRSIDAGIELFAGLFDRGDLVGVAAFDTVPCFLGTGAGDKHQERSRQLFAGHPAISSLPPALKDVEGQYVDPMTHIRRRLSPDAQIMLFSPLCDDYSAEVARRLDSVGHLVTVISPNPTASDTVGERLAMVEREMRIRELRERDIRVVNWDYDEQLGLEIQRAQTRWAT